MISVMKGVAHPWQCDILGHLTTRFYVALFDDASYHFLQQVFGWNGNRNADGTRGWVDVRHVIEYRAEVAAGDLLEVSAGLVKIGGKSMTVRYEMTNLGSGEIAATLECVCVLFDLQERVAAVITDELRSKASEHLLPSEDPA